MHRYTVWDNVQDQPGRAFFFFFAYHFPHGSIYFIQSWLPPSKLVQNLLRFKIYQNDISAMRQSTYDVTRNKWMISQAACNLHRRSFTYYMPHRKYLILPPFLLWWQLGYQYGSSVHYDNVPNSGLRLMAFWVDILA